jgi:membrane protein implicated in regulation of membrane protease activity
MVQPKAPNPERRSNSALLCLCIGMGLVCLAWFLGVGGMIGMAFEGGAPAAGGLIALILLPLTGIVGAIMASFGAVWLIVRVIADQRQDHAKERYSREVER